MRKSNGQILVDHEILRQRIALLNWFKSELVGNCKFYNIFGTAVKPMRDNCLVEVFNLSKTISKENQEFASYDDVLEKEILEGNVCCYCQYAMILKRGLISRTKKAIGLNKRAISARAKLLLKKCVNYLGKDF
mgnify:CR=1 FL=1